MLGHFIFLFAVVPFVWASDIHGVIRMAPPYPSAKKIQVQEKYRNACSNEQVSQSLIVSGNGLIKNAVIFLDGNFKSENVVERNALILDQKNCNFQPHILIVKEGSNFLIANSDPMAHDVRAFDRDKMVFRFEMDPFGKPVAKRIEGSGTYVIRCGLHPWMYAFVVNAKHPFYAVSGEGGEFELHGVPNGIYKLRIWHETLGEAEVPIEVKGPIEDFSYVFKN